MSIGKLAETHEAEIKNSRRESFKHRLHQLYWNAIGICGALGAASTDILH